MKKYMKYEIKGSYKFILGILAIVIIASTILQGNLKVGMDKALLYGDGTPTNFAGSMMGISFMVIFGAFLVAFFQIVGSFRKELYDDRGYLTFTLPLTGNQILGAKIIVAILWFVVLGVTIVVYNLLLALILYGGDWLYIGKEIFSMINSGMLSLGIVSGLSSIMTLILIYFSMALSRVSFRNKKVGGLWFVVFIILNSLAGYFVFKISNVAPYFLDLSSFKILPYYQLNILPSFSNGIGDLMIFGSNYTAYINILGTLSHIVISVAAFLGTGYLIEKKIDL